MDIALLGIRDQAACVGVDSDWFFLRRKAIKHGVEVCRQCPVRKECLAYAYENDQLGLWGGHWFRVDPQGSTPKVTNLL